MNKGLGKQYLLLIVVLLLALTGTGIAYALTVQTLPQTKLSPPQGWVTVTQAQFQEGVWENVTISGWPYRKPVTITNSGAALTDYQVKVDVPYDSHMQQDFDDIRFFDGNGNSLSHWRESYTASTSAVFWVKVPSIPTGNSTIYMHYGDESASSASNGTATFVFFDDFESGNLDKWTVITDTFWTIATDQKRSGTYSLKAGFTDRSNKYIVATGVDESDLVYDSWWYATATTPDICSQFRASNTYPYNDYHINWEGRWTIAEHVNGTVNGAGWISINSVSGTLPLNTWFKATIIIKGSPGQMKFLLDDVQINPASGWVDVGTDHTSGTVGHRAWTANNDWWIDDVRARKYADPEPTTTIGAEEELSLCKVELAAKSDWYSANWTCRRPVTINNTGGTLTDYQIKVTVSYDSDMQDDFDDIRFTDSDGQTLLSHWRESYTANTSALFWVNVTSIPASSTKTIYIYYGNPAAGSASDGDATFDLWDAMENTDNWTITTTGGGTVTADATHVFQGSYSIRIHDTNSGVAYATRTDNPTGNETYEIQFYDLTSQPGTEVQAFAVWDRSNDVMVGVASNIDATHYVYNFGGTVGSFTVARSNGWHKFTISWDGTNYRILCDDQDEHTQGGYGAPNIIAIGSNWVGAASNFWYDALRVRKYASPEPTTTTGAEEGFYAASGTIASEVYDTGKSGASWDWLGWNGTVEAGVTNITFKVRASDTAFAKDNATLPWQDASALPVTGRYQQWRATLTTSDTSVTPVLHEVRVLYS